MVGRLFSFWEDLFSGALLVLEGETSKAGKTYYLIHSSFFMIGSLWALRHKVTRIKFMQWWMCTWFRTIGDAPNTWCYTISTWTGKVGTRLDFGISCPWWTMHFWTTHFLTITCTGGETWRYTQPNSVATRVELSGLLHFKLTASLSLLSWNWILYIFKYRYTCDYMISVF